MQVGNQRLGLILATTALDIDARSREPCIALHQGCVKYSPSSRSVVDVLPPALITHKEFEVFYSQVVSVYEQMLPELGEALSKILSVRYSERYWRIVIGPWLEWFCGVVAERLVSLQAAIELRDDWVLNSYDSNEEYYPADSAEFIRLVKGDEYNSKIYADIASILGLELRLIHSDGDGLLKIRSKSTFRQRLRSLFHFSLNQFRTSPSVTLINSGIDRGLLLRIFIKSYGKVFPGGDSIPFVNLPCESDRALRTQLEVMLPTGNDGLFSVLLRLLPRYLPRCFLENFNHLRQRALFWFGRPPKHIVTAHSFYFNEPFQIWAAESMLSGTKLVAVQHGGSFKVTKLQPWSDHELRITDYFFQWGRASRTNLTKIQPMFSQNILCQLRRKVIKKKYILYPSTIAPRFQLYLSPLYSPNGFLEYLDWRLRFVNGLSNENQRFLLVRPHSEDMGWKITERMKDACGYFLVDARNENFIKALQRSSLHVCDYIGTTYVESLGLNHPTILIFNKSQNEISEVFVEIFNKLASVSILHFSPESAANLVNQISGMVEEWWYEPERQSVVAAFCSMTVGDVEQGERQWFEVLSKL